ncbi:hypothetical protein ATX70_01380 [Oenococcus oeni]|nr:hypothetical protein ATX70_01380 [Oenococcus oeni]
MDKVYEILLIVVLKFQPGWLKYTIRHSLLMVVLLKSPNNDNKIYFPVLNQLGRKQSFDPDSSD